MKKIVSVLFSLVLIFTFIISFYIYNAIYTEKELYDQTTSMNITFTEKATKKEILQTLEDISIKFGVNVSRYVYRNQNDINIYTTNINMFAVSNDTNHSLKMPNDKRNIYVYDIENVGELTTYDGIYQIDTVDKNIINNIETYSNNSSIIGYYNVTNYYENMTGVYNSIFFGLISYSPFFILTMIIFLVTIFVMLKIAISEARTISILDLNGFDIKKTLIYTLNNFKYNALFSLGISTLFIYIFIIFNSHLKFLIKFFGINIIWFLLLCLVSILLFSITIVIIFTMNNKLQLIKGNDVKSFMYYIELIVKYVLIVFMIVLFSLVYKYNTSVNREINSDSSWINAENIYKIEIRDMPDDLAEIRKIEFNSKRFYDELMASNKNAFSVNVSNYRNFDDTMKIYDANAMEDPTKIYSASGKTIKVNENYLKREGMEYVLKDVIIDPNVMNILVPASLKDKEDIIYNNFLDNFKWFVIDTPNIYKERINEINTVPKEEDLSVNIIYVEDGIDYFTYNASVMIENQNMITDPIVIVDMGNLDPSLYFSSMTRNVFFESESLNPYDDISNLVAENSLSSHLYSLESIYDTRVNSIQTLITQRNLSMFVMAITITLLICFLYLLNHSYFEENKYSIFVKTVNGYSLTRIFKKKLIVELTLDIIVIGILCYFGVSIFAILIIPFDILLTYAFSLNIHEKSMLKVLKGGI